MLTYRLTTPCQLDELLQADSARREGVYTVLARHNYVMGRPREVVVRRVPASVVVEEVDGLEAEDRPLVGSARDPLGKTVAPGPVPRGRSGAPVRELRG